jgi:hypothetical protein
MTMGQVWSSANFAGIDSTGFVGGRGSVVAVTAQNPGPDGVWDTADDLLTPMNKQPSEVSIDWTVGPNDADQGDRVRGFYSFHAGGTHFANVDAATHFVADTIDLQLYRHLSNRQGNVAVSEF